VASGDLWLEPAGFKSNPGTDELALGTDKLAKMELPDWVHIGYAPH
jgi:hypothetical protein